MAFRIQVRRDTAAKWEINNPVLLSGEMGYETDTGSVKFGDGQTDWNGLGYFTPAGETEIQVQYGGSPLGAYRILNFIGTGATLGPGSTNTIDITIPGQGPVGPTGQLGPTGPAGTLEISTSSGTLVQAATGIQFIGSGVVVTNVGDTAIVDVLSTAGTDVLYNSVSRYLANDGGSAQIWITSSSTVRTSLPWIRSGNTITITESGHGHLSGENVIIRNVNVDNEYAPIISVTPNTFSFDVSSTAGATSGGEAAYSMGFGITGASSIGTTVLGPSGGDVQLLSMLITTGTRAASNYVLTLPQSSQNGSGAYTGLNNLYFPIMRAQNLQSGTIVNANLTLPTSSPFNTLTLTGLPVPDAVGIRLNF
jgi:hypothetical protein